MRIPRFTAIAVLCGLVAFCSCGREQPGAGEPAVDQRTSIVTDAQEPLTLCPDRDCGGKLPSIDRPESLGDLALPTRQCPQDDFRIWDADLLPDPETVPGVSDALAMAVDALGEGVCPAWFTLESVRSAPPFAVFQQRRVPKARVYEFRYYHCNGSQFPHGPHSQDVRVWIPEEAGEPCISVATVRLAL